ncbi:hypothetical protein SNARM312S_07973 [Streptomyces narbonensis]
MPAERSAVYQDSRYTSSRDGRRRRVGALRLPPLAEPTIEAPGAPVTTPPQPTGTATVFHDVRLPSGARPVS